MAEELNILHVPYAGQLDGKDVTVNDQITGEPFRIKAETFFEAAIDAETAAQQANEAREAIQGDLTAMNGRIDAVEIIKADKSELVASLNSQKKTGLRTVNTGGGILGSTDSAVYGKNGTICAEVTFITPKELAGIQRIVSKNNSDSNIRVDLANTSLYIYSFGTVSVANMLPNTLYQLVIFYNADTNTRELYLNGEMISTSATVMYANPTFLIFLMSDGVGIAPFKGKLISYREFSQKADVSMLYNNGRPDKLTLSSAQRANLIHEFIPATLTPTSWKDTVTGLECTFRPHGTTATEVEVCYDDNDASVGDEVVIDSGVFHTNIATGVATKVLVVPQGYMLERVLVRNFNSTDLTTINAVFASTDNIITNGTISGARSAMVACANTRYNPVQANNLAVNATGNTESGGMQIKAFCKRIKF